VTDPLHAALAAVLARHGITDPDAVTDAADAAVAVLGRDRCTCRASVHDEHHHTVVDDCPWCAGREARR
jgi:DNA-binding helix-hairpin-helix protein with protein kinase domain